MSFLQFSSSGNNNGLPGRHYQHIGLNLEGGDTNDHYLGHEDVASRRRNQARIFRWYYEQLAYLVERLEAIPEGEGTLFDNTTILTTSEFGMFNHRFNDLPYMVVSGRNVPFRKGVYLDAYRNDSHRPHGDMLLAVARGLGVNLDRVGDSTTPYIDMLA